MDMNRQRNISIVNDKRAKTLKAGLILISSFCFSSFALADKYPFDFFKEKIMLSVDRNEIHIKGIYYIRNNSSKEEELMIFYPFPIDSFHDYPHRISIHYINADKDKAEEKYIKERDGIIWPLRIDSGKTKCILIEYSQKIRAKEATYITTTTQGWGKAIEDARFIVSVPADFKEVKISYQPDRAESKDNKIYYYMNEESFLPEEDLIVKWK